MFSIRYTSYFIGVQILLIVAVLVVGLLWRGDALIMGITYLYYPFTLLAWAVGLEGVIWQFIAGVVVGIPVYGLLLGAALKWLKGGERFS